MEKFLGSFSPYIYAIFRIVVGFLFTLHGSQKLFAFPPSGKPSAPLAGLVLAAGIIEFAGGLLVMIGLQAGFAAFICSGTMAVAYFKSHQPMGALPIQNGGELAALYSFVFLYIAARGSGELSVDSLVFKKS